METMLDAGAETISHARMQPETELVSVVVLNYNYARYLKECIDSVLAQDHQPMEVIVVDDGSTDNSREVIDSYAGRLRASFKPNGGMVSAMNHGFQLTRGSVVIFIDADDYLLPGAVAAHAQALSQSGVVRSQTYLRILNGSQPSSDETIPARSAPQGDLRALVLHQGPGAYVSAPNSGNAWCRRFLEQVFPLPENLKSIGAETYLMDSAPLFGQVATLKQPYAAYRLHGENMNGKLVGMTAKNIRSIVAQHDVRIMWLEGLVTSLGHKSRAAEWKSRNWRLLTLRYLMSRISGEGEAPGIVENVRAAFGIKGNAVKRLILAFAVLCIRLAPFPAALFIAGRMIKLRYM